VNKRLFFLRKLFARDNGVTVDLLIQILAGNDDPSQGVKAVPVENRRLFHQYLLELKCARDLQSTLDALESAK
jgi:hypothetical protein